MFSLIRPLAICSKLTPPLLCVNTSVRKNFSHVPPCQVDSICLTDAITAEIAYQLFEKISARVAFTHTSHIDDMRIINNSSCIRIVFGEQTILTQATLTKKLAEAVLEIKRNSESKNKQTISTYSALYLNSSNLPTNVSVMIKELAAFHFSAEELDYLKSSIFSSDKKTDDQKSIDNCFQRIALNIKIRTGEILIINNDTVICRADKL